jgi:hypothetical protein
MSAQKRFWQWIAIASFLFFLPGPAPAQKAKPVRIQFPRGSASALLQGQLRGRQQQDYVAGAGKEQTLILQLASAPSGSLAIKVYDPEDREVALQRSSARRWTAVLPRAGDYGIAVLRVSEKAGVSTYRLTVTIR